MHSASPRPFATAVTFIALAGEIPIREWRDTVLPRYKEIRSTAAYRAARLELADALDSIGDSLAREQLVRRTADVAESIAWYADRSPQADGLDARAAARILTAAALAVWMRSQLTVGQFATLIAPFEPLVSVGWRLRLGRSPLGRH